MERVRDTEAALPAAAPEERLARAGDAPRLPGRTRLDQASLCLCEPGGRSGEQQEWPGLELEPSLLGCGRRAQESRTALWRAGRTRQGHAGHRGCRGAPNPLAALGWLLLYQMSPCCRQQARAVVMLCVMGLSCTENKLCQPSACPVMMLCLSSTVLRRGCLLCREETCILLRPAASVPSLCWEGSAGVAPQPALPALGHAAASASGHRDGRAEAGGAGSGESCPSLGSPCLQPWHTAELQGTVPPAHSSLRRENHSLRPAPSPTGLGQWPAGSRTGGGHSDFGALADHGSAQVSSQRSPAVLFLTRHLSLTHCLGNKLKHFYVFAARYLIL